MSHEKAEKMMKDLGIPISMSNKQKKIKPKQDKPIVSIAYSASTATSTSGTTSATGAKYASYYLNTA